MLVMVGLLPWVAFLLVLLLGVRLPRPLPATRSGVGEARSWPRVSVVIPARNEAGNIPTVLGSVTAADYPDFEVVVVDDRSTDGTGDRARAFPRGNARDLRVVEGADLPEGWTGKPWACHQGAGIATGEILLFTDADTWHGPRLMRHAMEAMREDGAQLLTVAGRQRMLTFWERLVQPQIFTGMLLRYRDQRRPLPPERWRDAIANGQFILVPADTYWAEGGHEALKGEVVEDLRMAQRWVRHGHRVSVRMAEDDFATRMYASLKEITEGWSKNIVLGGAATLPEGWPQRVAAPVSVLTGVILWIVPPVALGAALAWGGGGPGLTWASAAVGISALTWALVSRRMGVPPLYGFLYPMGAAASIRIILRAWRLGRDVEWKGRRYRVGAGAGEL